MEIMETIRSASPKMAATTNLVNGKNILGPTLESLESAPSPKKAKLDEEPPTNEETTSIDNEKDKNGCVVETLKEETKLESDESKVSYFC